MTSADCSFTYTPHDRNGDDDRNGDAASFRASPAAVRLTGQAFATVTLDASGVDASAVTGQSYYYEVVATNDTTTSKPSDAVQVTDAPADINGIDDTPANGITYNVLHGKTLTITAANLLANDNDPNNNPSLTIQSFTQPGHGTLTDNGDGTLTYTAEKTYVGPDSFTYTPTDQYGAKSNAATVQVQVTDNMPEASSAIIPVLETQDANGDPVPAQVKGTLIASDLDGDPLTFSASVISGEGGFIYDSSTGAYTFTPSQSDGGPVVIVFTAKDGALTSNKASLIFPGWKIGEADIGEDDKGVPDGDDNALIAGLNLPLASNQHFNVCQNGQLQVYPSAGLMSVAQDTDPASPDNDSPSPAPLIENPQHGSVSVDSYGSFTYTPNAGFVGRDWFTWQVQDGGKLGEYATVFIDVEPLTVSLSVNQLKPGDPSAEVPNDQFPPDAAGDPQYATINLNISASPGLPEGSTVTLSVNSDVQNDLDVYDGVPGASGTNLLFGKDAGSDSYTWTVANGQVQPRAVYAVGLAGTNYDQAVFTLSVSVGTTVYGDPSSAAPPATPSGGSTINGMQPGTVQGKGGALEAFDGTNDYEVSKTDIRRFYMDDYLAYRTYWRGVANPADNPRVLRLIPLVFGDGQAHDIERQGFQDLADFYKDPSKWSTPTDIIGYSRGAMEAVKLANDLTDSGIPVVTSKKTLDGKAEFTYVHPLIRYVGLISPVMGALEAPGLWPRSLPAGVEWAFQALDNEPNNPIPPQYTITRAAGTKGSDVAYALGHGDIGGNDRVLKEMVAEAKQSDAPVQ